MIRLPPEDRHDELCLTPENRLLAQTESLTGTITRTWTYSYEPADRLTQALANPGGTYAYTLDAAASPSPTTPPATSRATAPAPTPGMPSSG